MNLIKVSVNVHQCALRSLLSSRALHTSLPLSDKTYYEILRVPSTASQTELKEAYYRLSKVYHPDIANDENSLKMFRSITEAYDVLGNVRSRIQYDKENGFEPVVHEVRFHPTGVKEYTEHGAVLPDFDKKMAKKSIHEDWEDSEYQKRRIEILAAKQRVHQEDPWQWDQRQKNLLLFGVAFFTTKLCVTWLDEHYYERFFDPQDK